MKEKILITGGSGFIGTNLIQHYLDQNYDIINVDIKPPRNPSHSKFFYFADLLDEEGLIKKITEFGPDYILHFAARTDLREDKNISGYDANIKGVNNLITAAERCTNLKRVIFASSMLVCKYGYMPKNKSDYCPNTLYGQSKVMTENIIHQSNLSCAWLIVRPTSIWGPWFGTPYNDFFKCILNGKYFHPSDKAGTCTVGYIGNTVYQVDCLLKATAEKIQGKVFYLGDTPPIKLSDWADQISLLAGRKKNIVLPFPLIKAAAILGDILLKFNVPFPLTSFRLQNITMDNIIDLDSTYNLAPDPPWPLKEGMIQTLNWLKHEN